MHDILLNYRSQARIKRSGKLGRLILMFKKGGLFTCQAGIYMDHWQARDLEDLVGLLVGLRETLKTWYNSCKSLWN
ncbi:hypothetical protein ACHQM5_024247 [Ranunculus cassubicifolius]